MTKRSMWTMLAGAAALIIAVCALAKAGAQEPIFEVRCGATSATSITFEWNAVPEAEVEFQEDGSTGWGYRIYTRDRIFRELTPDWMYAEVNEIEAEAAAADNHALQAEADIIITDLDGQRGWTMFEHSGVQIIGYSRWHNHHYEQYREGIERVRDPNWMRPYWWYAGGEIKQFSRSFYATRLEPASEYTIYVHAVKILILAGDDGEPGTLDDIGTEPIVAYTLKTCSTKGE